MKLDMPRIRPEQDRDRAQVRAVNEAAFGRRAEADLVDALRGRARPMISLVACDPSQGGAVIGHALFTPITVEGSDARSAMALGPIAVHPDRQRRGIGSKLIEAGLDACRAAGHNIVFVVGDPQFYQRFGFGAARRHGVSWDRPVPDDVFMLVELTEGSVRSLTRGHPTVVHYLPQFDLV